MHGARLTVLYIANCRVQPTSVQPMLGTRSISTYPKIISMILAQDLLYDACKFTQKFLKKSIKSEETMIKITQLQ